MARWILFVPRSGSVGATGQLGVAGGWFSVGRQKHGSAERLDDRDQLLGRIALLAREAQELASARDDRAALWGSADAYAVAAAEVEQPLVA